MAQSIDKSRVNRREFLKQSGSLAAGAAVLGNLAPVAFARGDGTIRHTITKGGADWNFRVQSKHAVRENGNEVDFNPGDIEIVIGDNDMVISPNAANNYVGNGRSALNKFFEYSFAKFANTGHIGLLKDRDGAGFVLVIDEFGNDAPDCAVTDDGIRVYGVQNIKIFFFEKGGYKEYARQVRAWMKKKGYYRNICEKPYAKELKGAVHIRPVQHGAISEKTWDLVQSTVPKAFFIWRVHGGPAAGLEKFTVELQKKLDQKGTYYFMPWAGLLQPPSAEEGLTGLNQYSFSTVPGEMLRNWSVIERNGELFKPMVSHGKKPAKRAKDALLCPLFLPQRMDHWINKIRKHPNNYRLDGVNIDTLMYYAKGKNYYGGCYSKEHPSDYADLVKGMTDMAKIAYDKGLMVGHEGNGFYLEKYCLSTYGQAMTSLGLYGSWHLIKPGINKPYEETVRRLTKHFPINEMIYHDQLAMRIHDCEAINMRYASDEDSVGNRKVKLAFIALYGLTPHLQFGGSMADELITEDHEWMKKDMPRITETYDKLYGQELVDHQFLSDDDYVQMTQWKDGTIVIANFSEEDYSHGHLTIPALDYVLIEKGGK